MFYFFNYSILARKTTSLSSSQKTNWGTWGNAEYCDYGSFVVGFRTRVEAPVGEYDDTGLNAIELFCSNNKTITSKQGKLGDWGKSDKCKGNGLVNGFRFKTEPRQNIFFVQRDDTAANAIRLSCSDEQFVELKSSEGHCGRWDPVYKYCPPNLYVCGLKTQVHDEISSKEEHDLTGLNNVILYCCNV